MKYERTDRVTHVWDAWAVNKGPGQITGQIFFAIHEWPFNTADPKKKPRHTRSYPLRRDRWTNLIAF